jgi:microcystin-dependent protein
MSNPFLSEIRIMSFNIVPKGWAVCNGQLLPINQNQALFSLLGTTYGGDGRVNFALPNLQGRVPIHMGQGYTLGGVGGENSHTLTINEMPVHTHALMTDATTAGSSNSNTPSGSSVLGQSAGTITPNGSFNVQMYGVAPTGALDPHSVGNTGGSQPHENRQPFTVLSFCIATQGIFPSRT